MNLLRKKKHKILCSETIYGYIDYRLMEIIMNIHYKYNNRTTDRAMYRTSTTLWVSCKKYIYISQIVKPPNKYVYLLLLFYV